jgi:hypothetical protein
VEQPGEFALRARDEAGHTVVTKLMGVTDAERKSNPNPVNAAMIAGVVKVMGWPPENQALRFIKDPEVAEIRLRYFVGGDFPKWVEDTFGMLRPSSRSRHLYRRRDGRRILWEQLGDNAHADAAALEGGHQAADVRVLERGSGIRRQTPGNDPRSRQRA